MKEFKNNALELLKTGIITPHITKSNGKDYSKAKLYLKDSSLVGKNYEMYDLEDVRIEESFGIVNGKGVLIFLPSVQRKKDKIGLFGEHRLSNRYLSKLKKF